MTVPLTVSSKSHLSTSWVAASLSWVSKCSSTAQVHCGRSVDFLPCIYRDTRLLGDELQICLSTDNKDSLVVYPAHRMHRPVALSSALASFITPKRWLYCRRRLGNPASARYCSGASWDTVTVVRKRAATLFTDFALITIAEVLATYSSRRTA